MIPRCEGCGTYKTDEWHCKECAVEAGKRIATLEALVTDCKVENQKIIAENVELKEDEVRMDWMKGGQGMKISRITNKLNGIPYFAGWRVIQKNIQVGGDDLRQAIDAAIKEAEDAQQD